MKISTAGPSFLASFLASINFLRISALCLAASAALAFFASLAAFAAAFSSAVCGVFIADLADAGRLTTRVGGFTYNKEKHVNECRPMRNRRRRYHGHCKQIIIIINYLLLLYLL